MTRTVDIDDLEENLRRAMLNSDVKKLESLISDTLVFTNQDGIRLTKEDDIEAHRSGILEIVSIASIGERIVRFLGDAIIVCVSIELIGKYAGEHFAGRFAYSRVWSPKNGKWQVEVAHCSHLSAPYLES